MTDDAVSHSSPLAHISSERQTFLFYAAEQAVSIINGALGSRLAQPSLAPTDAVAWRAACSEEACRRLAHLWNALEPARPDEDPALTRLRAAGVYTFHSLLSHFLVQGAAGTDFLRQFTTQPGPPPSASPAPGGSP